MFFSSEQTEGSIFRLGCSLFALEVMALFILFLLQPESTVRIVAVITASILGGRMASILTGLELGLHPLSIILILFIFNSIWLFVMFPLIVTFSRHVMNVKFFGKMLGSTMKMAKRQKDKIAKYGTWGLPLFIWLPFPWTGGLIGAAVGFLIGMSTRRTMLVVMPSMLIGIVSWVLGFEYLFLLTGITGKTICIVILAGILLAPILRSG